jgi:uncharacterized BrkB/YihY/UPF0761 family membrane protein
MQQIKEKNYTPKYFRGRILSLLLLLLLLLLVVVVAIVIVLAYHFITENHSVIMACVV